MASNRVDNMPTAEELREFNDGVKRARHEAAEHPTTGYNTSGRSMTAQGRKEAPTNEDLRRWNRDLREQLREVTAERDAALYELNLIRNRRSRR